VALKAQDNPQEQLQQRAEQENDDAWSQVVDHVQQLVAEAPDLPTLQNQLLAAYSGLPLDDLQSVMAQGFALAQLAGMFDVKTGQ
jgi:phage gp29-like protein